MEENNDVYVSVDREEYKKDKRNILNSQANLLSMLKYIYNLQVLSRRKNDLKKKLHKTSSKIIIEIDLLMSKLPKPSVPEKFKKISEEDEEHDVRRHRDIETELKLIREKLKGLNN